MLLNQLSLYLQNVLQDLAEIQMSPLPAVPVNDLMGFWFDKLNLEVSKEKRDHLEASRSRSYVSNDYVFDWTYDPVNKTFSLQPVAGQPVLSWEKYYRLNQVTSEMFAPVVCDPMVVQPNQHYILDAGAVMPFTYLGRSVEKQAGAQGKLRLSVSDTAKQSGYVEVYACSLDVMVFVDMAPDGKSKWTKDQAYQTFNQLLASLLTHVYVPVQDEYSTATRRLHMETQQVHMQLVSIEQLQNSSSWRFIGKLQYTADLMVSVQDLHPVTASTIRHIITDLQ